MSGGQWLPLPQYASSCDQLLLQGRMCFSRDMSSSTHAATPFLRMKNLQLQVDFKKWRPPPTKSSSCEC